MCEYVCIYGAMLMALIAGMVGFGLGLTVMVMLNCLSRGSLVARTWREVGRE